jgi:ABC-type bacteriocin/lantibiotic exporter with double-glycine peptidase domain
MSITCLSVKFSTNNYHLKRIHLLLTYKEIYDLDAELTGNRIIEKFKLLQTENLTVQLDNTRELKIPDMIVKKGEKVLIVGKSGIGKSSFFNILLGFIKSCEGTISVNGVNLKEYDIKSIRNPYVILIDESFSSLDEYNVDLIMLEIQKNIRNLLLYV